MTERELEGLKLRELEQFLLVRARNWLVSFVNFVEVLSLLDRCECGGTEDC